MDATGPTLDATSVGEGRRGTRLSELQKKVLFLAAETCGYHKKFRLANEYSLYHSSTAESVARSSATDARPIGLCLIPRTLFRTLYTPARLCIHQQSIEFVIPAMNKSPPMYPVSSKAYAQGPWRESWSSLHRCSEFRVIERTRLRRLATLLSKCRDSTEPVVKAHLYLVALFATRILLSSGLPQYNRHTLRTVLMAQAKGQAFTKPAGILSISCPPGVL